jgi:DNA mismatch repair ATPase MutS
MKRFDLEYISDRASLSLDEIGKGTSTYDGISIAWALQKFLHEHPSGLKHYLPHIIMS